MGVSASVDPYDEAAGPQDGRAAPPSPDESALLVAAVGGDHDAFAALYDRHADRVFRHCYYRTANRADAEDLTQQTFLHAWRAIRRYRATGAPFVAWLLAISQNLTTSHHRRVREIIAEPARLEMERGGDDPADLVLGGGVRHDRVRRAVLRLAPERRQVIILRFVEEFTVAEVAAALGKSENNVRVIQHRALADLRRFLTEPTVENGPPKRGLFERVRDAITVQYGGKQ
jgi:RNA polymerase sigma-70 factor (ECF subfamily)